MALKRWLPSTTRNAIYNVRIQRDSSSCLLLRFCGLLIVVLFHRERLLESIKEKDLETSKKILLKHIELNLYVDASSMVEYADISTLKRRMVRVVKQLMLMWIKKWARYNRYTVETMERARQNVQLSSVHKVLPSLEIALTFCVKQILLLAYSWGDHLLRPPIKKMDISWEYKCTKETKIENIKKLSNSFIS